MATKIATAPRGTGGPRPFTYADLEEMPDDGYRREIIGGSLIVSPSPANVHQRIAIKLSAILLAAEQPDTMVLIAPCDWNLPSGDSVEPDLLVIRRQDYIPSGHVPPSATPLLLVEILSPSNVNYDRLIKRALYESLGVPTYWIVDPEGPSILALRLDNGTYRVDAEVSGDQTFATDWPYPVELVPAALTR